MKVAIVTITEGTNYGNRLQNYAVQKYIEKLGIEAETLINKSGTENKNVGLLLKIKRRLSVIKNYFINLKNREIIHKRKEIFNNFNNENIKFSDIIINNDYEDSKINDIYDYFVCGSDQIWNPTFKENANANFLQFANINKRIAFSPSFGVSDIPNNRIVEYKNYLKDFSWLSVRENEGAKIIKKLSNKNAEVLVDPTLLLSKNEWEELCKRPKNVSKEKYILTYFLGNISEERKNELQKLANEHNFDIINLGKIEYKQYYIAGPSEFLWYIKNAEIVFTDSFHACVFSIIFNKTFYVLDREDKMQSMNSRIETLLNKLDLKQQKFNSWDNIKIDHDYSHVDLILEKEREKSLNFLKKALDIEE